MDDRFPPVDIGFLVKRNMFCTMDLAISLHTLKTSPRCSLVVHDLHSADVENVRVPESQSSTRVSASLSGDL